jgi:hypothetical protein
VAEGEDEDETGDRSGEEEVIDAGDGIDGDDEERIVEDEGGADEDEAEEDEENDEGSVEDNEETEEDPIVGNGFVEEVAEELTGSRTRRGRRYDGGGHL